MIARLFKRRGYKDLLDNTPMLCGASGIRNDVEFMLSDDAVGNNDANVNNAAANSNSNAINSNAAVNAANSNANRPTLTSEDYVYIELSDGINGFIMKRDKARKIITLLEIRIGTEKLHNPVNRDKVCHVLHKRSVLDITHDEWKAMGKNKPKRANW